DDRLSAGDVLSIVAALPADRPATEQHELPYPVGMPRRIAERRGRPMADTHQIEPLEPGGLDDALQVFHKSVRADDCRSAARSPMAAAVVADEAVAARKPVEPLAPDRPGPIALEVIEPVGDLDQRSPIAAYGKSQACPVNAGAMPGFGSGGWLTAP